MTILLVRSGGLGDCILTLPVVSCLKRIKPASSLHVLGNATMLSLARLTGEFDGLHSFDDAGFAALFTGGEPSEFLCSFFSPFDEVYFFTAGDGELIKRKVTASGARLCRTLNPIQPESWKKKHITGHLMSIIEGFGNNRHIQYEPMMVSVRKSSVSRKGLVIHPGSGDVKKNWPIDRFIAVAERFYDEVTFVLGPAENDRGLEKELPEDTFSVVCTESLEELCDLLSGASLYLGNDSGVSHCAGLCGTPGAVLFGPTDPVVWKPVGKCLTVLSSGDSTMQGISVNEVLDALQSV